MVNEEDWLGPFFREVQAPKLRGSPTEIGMKKTSSFNLKLASMTQPTATSGDPLRSFPLGPISWAAKDPLSGSLRSGGLERGQQQLALAAAAAAGHGVARARGQCGEAQVAAGPGPLAILRASSLGTCWLSKCVNKNRYRWDDAIFFPQPLPK